MPADLRQQLQDVADKEDRPQSWVMRQALKQYIATHREQSG